MAKSIRFLFLLPVSLSQLLFSWKIVGPCGCALLLLGAGCRPPEAKKAAPGEPSTVIHGQGDLPSTKFEFRTQPNPVVAGQVAIWDLKVIRKSRERGAGNFKVTGDKMLHFIAVSDDLSWFRHLTPEYKDYGHFVTSCILPRAGTYHAYASYTPNYGARVPTRHENARVDFKAVAPGTSESTTLPSPQPGTTAGSVVPLTPDTHQNGWYITTVQSKPEDAPEAEGGATYQVALKSQEITVGEKTNLHFQVRSESGQPIADLQPHRAVGGYVSLISQNKQTFLYALPQVLRSGMSTTQIGGTSGPDMTFETTFPRPGNYKLWAEFKHQDRIITAPFVVKVDGANRVNGTDATRTNAAPKAIKGTQP
jgi:hypothetical protein